jgi:hypothetical protein
VDFYATGKLMIIYPAFVRYLKNMECNGVVYQLVMDIK